MPAKKISKTKKTKPKTKDLAETSTTKKAEIVEDTTNLLLELMGLKAKAVVRQDDQNQAIQVNIDTVEEAGLLIGNRGRTLQALQSIIGLMIRNKLGEWIRIIVNVSDWREKEEERLKNLATQVASRAKETGEPQTLYNLTSAQRRIIHLTLSEDSEITTESVGEGKDRYLVVSSSK